MRNVFSTRVILRDEIRLCFYFFVVCESCAVEMICITTNCKYPRHVRCVVISSLVHKYQRFNSFKLHPLFSLLTREAPAGSLSCSGQTSGLFFVLVFFFFSWGGGCFICLFGCLLFIFFPTPSLFVLHTFAFFPLADKNNGALSKTNPQPLVYTVNSSRRILLFFLNFIYNF